MYIYHYLLFFQKWTCPTFEINDSYNKIINLKKKLKLRRLRRRLRCNLMKMKSENRKQIKIRRSWNGKGRQMKRSREKFLTLSEQIERSRRMIVAVIRVYRREQMGQGVDVQKSRSILLVVGNPSLTAGNARSNDSGYHLDLNLLRCI